MTAQIKDILIFNDEKLYLSCEPLEKYLESINLPYKLIMPNTGCARGYYSKWIIENNKLFLIGWEGYILEFMKVGMDYLFPGEEFVFANWFTGNIKIQVGKLINYVHGGYFSVYEGTRYLEFKSGILVNEYTKYLTQEEIAKIIQDEEDLPF